jgi:hypothetical protein
MTSIRPIQGECMRYFVGSASNPDQQHLVDLLENECGCPDWTCRHGEYERRTGKEYSCRHIKEAWEQVKLELREALKEQELVK